MHMSAKTLSASLPKSSGGAIRQLLGVDRPIPPIYQGLHDPKVVVRALQAAF